MRYLWLILLAFMAFVFPPTVEAKPKPRQSSVKTVRNKQQINLKPLKYDPKKHRAQTVKKKHWWSRR
jgi:hypothetical protein